MIERSTAREFLEAVELEDVERITRMLADEPELVKARDDAGLSVLLKACYLKRKRSIEVLLKSEPRLDVFEAAALGDVPRLTELLDASTQAISATAPDGFTPLHLAAFFADRATVAFLLGRGADANAVSSNEMSLRPIHSAAAANPDAVEPLLDHGADANAQQVGGWTALHAAADRGNVRLVELLLARGADPSLASDGGQTPADMAETNHRTDALAVLMKQDPTNQA